MSRVKSEEPHPDPEPPSELHNPSGHPPSKTENFLIKRAVILDSVKEVIEIVFFPL